MKKRFYRLAWITLSALLLTSVALPLGAANVYAASSGIIPTDTAPYYEDSLPSGIKIHRIELDIPFIKHSISLTLNPFAEASPARLSSGSTIGISPIARIAMALLPKNAYMYTQPRQNNGNLVHFIKGLTFGVYYSYNESPTLRVISPLQNRTESSTVSSFTPVISVLDPDNDQLVCKYYLDHKKTPEEFKIVEDTQTVKIVRFNTINLSNGRHTLKFEINDGSETISREIVVSVNGEVRSAVSGDTDVPVDSASPSAPVIKPNTLLTNAENITVDIESGRDGESGVNRTEYQLTGPEQKVWTRYNGPFNITSEGETTVFARTVDNAGNASSITSVAVKIDRTAPPAPNLTVDTTSLTNKDVNLTIDNWANAEIVEYRIDNGLWQIHTVNPTLISQNCLVEARCADIAGNYSAIASLRIANIDKTPPTQPSNLKLETVSETSIWFTWEASSDNTKVTHYEIYRDGVRLTATTATLLNNTGLIPGKTHEYSVRAVDSLGNLSDESIKISASTLPDTLSPSVPTAIQVDGVTESTATISWQTSTDNSRVRYYEIYRDGAKVGTSITTSYTVTRLLPGTTYKISLKACDLSGNLSDMSTEAYATTLSDTQTPSTPEQPTASSITETSVILTWLPCTDNVKVKGYEIYRNGIRLKATSIPTLTVTGLLPGQTYSFTVKAFDDSGNTSAESTAVSVTTLK
ncbi:MAG: fibronectin type III domain-containing protein [Clostridia bacterium]|nr:fibronectin type III domain-containing protein [Clostridia bacterium]